MKSTRPHKTEDRIERRMLIVFLFFFASFIALGARLFVLQIAQYDEYAKIALRQQRIIMSPRLDRGEIFGQDKQGNLIPLAHNRTFKTLALAPKYITDPEAVMAGLVQEFALDKDFLSAKVNRTDDPYEVLLRKLDPERTIPFSQKRLAGVLFEDDRRRVYPSSTTAAHLLGFVSREIDAEIGRYGLERYYESLLSGGEATRDDSKYEKNFWDTFALSLREERRDAARIILTMDYIIQTKAEEILAAVREKWQAVSGSLIVLEPKTGRILAMAGTPSFDPNEFGKEKDLSVFLNTSVEAMYELGSVMKPITMAAGIEEGVVRPDSTYTDRGEMRIAGYTIKNFDERAYGVQTMMQVIEKSLNTGAVHVARLLGKDRQYEYLHKFGFGERTAIDLPGEVAGNLFNLDAGREIDFATAAFGQGIAITDIQLASAIGALANKGHLMKPHVVERIVETSGTELKIEPQLAREVVSSETADILTKMLVSAVRVGFENRAGVKGYFVAGKTGTAQIPKQDGRGYSEEYIHTYVGYAPAFNPRFVILIRLNKPKGNLFAANTLTLPFHDLAEFILHYYEVPPDEQEVKPVQ